MSQQKREKTRIDYSMPKIRTVKLAKRELSEAQLEALAGGGLPSIN